MWTSRLMSEPIIMTFVLLNGFCLCFFFASNCATPWWSFLLCVVFRQYFLYELLLRIDCGPYKNINHIKGFFVRKTKQSPHANQFKTAYYAWRISLSRRQYLIKNYHNITARTSRPTHDIAL